MKPKTDPTDLGANRTGAAASPRDSQKLVEGARQGVPRASFDLASLQAERVSFNDDAEPVGTVPPPCSSTRWARGWPSSARGRAFTRRC